MPLGEFQTHASNYSNHMFPKGEVPVIIIPDALNSI